MNHEDLQAMPIYETVLTDVDEAAGIGTIKMNRPRQLNALNSVMMNEMTDALQRFEGDERIRAIVVCAEGRAFSAGFDLKESAAKNYSGTAQWQQAIESDFNFIIQFWNCAKPTIAAVQGHCLAGGLELAVACDITVADDTAIFGEPEVKFGSSIVAMIVPWLIGPKQAKQMLFTGDDRIPAQRALDMGLINELVPAGDAPIRAKAIAASIASAAPLSVRMIKQAINRSLDLRGMRESLLAAVDTAIIVESSVGPERAEFNRIRTAEGLAAAIAWRNARSR